MGFLEFPSDFAWGCATAAAQIEGAALEDGKGESVWDRFATVPGKTENGDTPALACDHYHRFREDIALMASLGIKHYRLSLSWPRIMPTGRGRVNRAGIDFYRKLLTALKSAGISPMVTLFHWDLPQALQEEGGWLNRRIAHDFEAYARVCFSELGDLVDRWITHNEPAVVVDLGYGIGVHAPGLTRPDVSLQAAHHLLLSHGMAVKAFRESGLKGEIGLTLSMSDHYPASDKPEDIRAADLVHKLGAAWYADPAVKGSYPREALEHFGKMGRLPLIEDGDMRTIGQRIDFLGLNYYFGRSCRALPLSENPEGFQTDWRGDLPRTAMDWEILPDGLYRLLKRLAADYPGLPIHITENGAAFDDRPSQGGAVEDDDRIDYLRSHFAAAHRALSEGVPLKGYFVWSFMDNFEWGYGYGKRFGIVRVDYASQKRTVKKSGRWYQEVMRRNGVEG
jgi:beta-glucosidase